MPISFPVSKTDRFVFYSKSTLTILRKGVPWPREDGQPIEGLNPDIGYLIVVHFPDPPFDPATQKIIITETPKPLLEEYQLVKSVVALTQAELDAIAEAAADEALRQTILAGINDMKNGVGTQLERLVRLEKAVAFLARKWLQS